MKLGAYLSRWFDLGTQMQMALKYNPLVEVKVVAPITVEERLLPIVILLFLLLMLKNLLFLLG